MSVTRAGLAPGVAVSQYGGGAAKLVHAFKVSGSRVLADAMAGPLAGALAEALDGRPVALVPAPSSRSATRQRGYVPAHLLARAVARRIKFLGVDSTVVPALRLVAEVRDQSLLGRAERNLNLSGHMSVVARLRPALVGRGVVLVDDIVTTGSTLREMSRALAACGVVANCFATFSETL